jgi:hypothetical protein
MVRKREASRILAEQSQRMGVTCNKNKEKHRALTPGLEITNCGGCGACEAFDLMPFAESPVTAFRMFAHRAWRESDRKAKKKWEEEGVWEDCL